jgi:hypothetical protein
MTSLDRLPIRLLLGPVVVAILGSGPVARAQVEDEVDDDLPRAPVAVQPVISDQAFEQWIFGQVRNAREGRAKLDLLLTLQIEAVEQFCAITEIEKQKLQLAGRGDIKRFFDRVEEKRRRFQLVKHDQNRFGEIYQEIQPLQAIFTSGPFDENSILYKTLRKTLNGEQVAKYEKALREKRQYRYRAKVELVVGMLDEIAGFSALQRQRFVALILEGTQPPKRFGQYDFQVVMTQIARLPESKIKPIFDDAQWRLLSQQLGGARAMENHLMKLGFLPENEAAGQQPAKTGPGARQIEADLAPF